MPIIIPILSNGDRSSVLAHIRKQREAYPGFSVIDVGGSVAGWSGGVANAIVDINPPDPAAESAIRYFKVNISRDEDWGSVENYVAEHGRFDFSICTHTLEDIANPLLVSRKLSQISKAGYVAVPSKFVELSRFETVLGYGVSYRGYIHHRWIYSVRGGVFVGFPKVSFVEMDPFFDRIGGKAADANIDLSFYWRAPLNLQIVNGDYLGPSVDAVLGYYHDQLIGDDVDAVYGAVYEPDPAACV